MMTPATTKQASGSGITTNTMVSAGLLTTLVIAAIFAGRQMQRLDSVDETARETRTEVQKMRAEFQELRLMIIQQQRANTPDRQP